MKAFHSFWSRPNYVRNHGEIGFPDFELLTAILSALHWRRHNGSIRMITDERGAAYFRQLGLEGVWDEIDTGLDEIGPEVDPFLFWAAGKLYALQRMEAPCVMLDTDLIIWEDPALQDPGIWEREIVAAHAETLNPLVYPDPSSFRLSGEYQYPADWDFTVDAANTAFLYLRDPAFRDRYVAQALRFFRNLIPNEQTDPVNAMCFAEQRILPMCAKAAGKPVSYLLRAEALEEQTIATHIWGYKNAMRMSEEAHLGFCLQCVRRILKDFPEAERFLRGREDLRGYLDRVLEEKTGMHESAGTHQISEIQKI